MALPPTRLTELLYACRDADAMLAALIGAGCLTRTARRDVDGFRALAARAEEEVRRRAEEEGAASGANSIDLLADELERAGALSRRGLRFARESAL